MTEYKELLENTWRRTSCLGCGEVVKRVLDAWVEIGGTRSGTWTVAMGVDAGRALSDPLPPPAGEEVFFLGIAHLACVNYARESLRTGQANLDDELPILFIDAHEEAADFVRSLGVPANNTECPFCDKNGSGLSKEDIYPRWLLRELKRRGAVAKTNGRAMKTLPRLTTPVCADCNNTWMSALENDIKDLIISLIDKAGAISSHDQERLALWATKIAILLDANSDRALIPRGFGYSLRIQKKPHPGTRVWIAAYGDGKDVLAVHRWRIMAKHSEDVFALCTTFTIAKVAFQVFIPFFDGTLSPMEDFRGSVLPVWLSSLEALPWPPPYYFDQVSLIALAKRIYDNRAPVIMDVTLEPTRRIPPNQAS